MPWVACKWRVIGWLAYRIGVLILWVCDNDECLTTGCSVGREGDTDLVVLVQGWVSNREFLMNWLCASEMSVFSVLLVQTLITSILNHGYCCTVFHSTRTHLKGVPPNSVL